MGGDGSGVDAGLIGLFVLLALFAAGGLLMRSMLAHARKVPDSFAPVPPPAGRRGRDARGGATGAAGAAGGDDRLRGHPPDPGADGGTGDGGGGGGGE